MNVIYKEGRSEWIDILKGFLLLCIVFSHFGYVPAPIAFVIKPTGDVWVPAFFFLSGLLFNENRYTRFEDFLNSRFKSLLLPYLFFFFTFLLLDWNLYLKTESTLITALVSLFNAGGPPKESPLWFLISLFEISVIYYFIAQYFKNVIRRLALVFASTLVGYFMYLYGVHPPFGIDVLLSGLTFYGVGHLLNGYISRLIDNLNGYIKWILVATLLAIVSGFAASYNPDTVLGQNRINNFYLFYLTSICGTLSAITFSVILWNSLKRYCLAIKVFNFFRYIAIQGLPVLATHVYIIIVVDNFLKVFGFPHNSLAGFIFKTLAIALLIYFFIVPFVYNKLNFVFGKNKWSNLNFNK